MGAQLHLHLNIIQIVNVQFGWAFLRFHIWQGLLQIWYHPPTPYICFIWELQRARHIEEDMSSSFVPHDLLPLGSNDGIQQIGYIIPMIVVPQIGYIVHSPSYHYFARFSIPLGPWFCCRTDFHRVSQYRMILLFIFEFSEFWCCVFTFQMTSLFLSNGVFFITDIHIVCECLFMTHAHLMYFHLDVNKTLL